MQRVIVRLAGFGAAKGDGHHGLGKATTAINRLEQNSTGADSTENP